MRPTLALLAVLTASTAFAEPAVDLTAADVTERISPFSETIEHCYLDRTTNVRGAGQLAIELKVKRTGALEGVAVKTPGLAKHLSKAIDGCVKEALSTASFPARKTHTTATVPFFFQRTAAPNAGPQLSCFAASGCR